jgi:hypothetical protein
MSDMLSDILGKGSSPPESSEGESEPNDPDGHYRAFWVTRRPFVCELRSVHPVEHDLSYAYIYDTMAYSGDWSFFWVVTSFYVLKVRGRNLRPVVKAIRARSCGWIQEFNKARHSVPDDKGLPVITHISIEIKPAGETFREAAEDFKAPG